MKKRENLDIIKLSRLAWALNLLEIAVLMALAVLALQNHLHITDSSIQPLALAGCTLLCVNNVINLVLNGRWVRLDGQYDMLKEALGHVETLNAELRTQKHDFMNHLQVVFSLIEMGENSGATEYIEKIHGNMQKGSLSTRTSKPAVNALLRAKLADCEKRDIAAELWITSGWRMLPIEEWEMCRILGNIIDNAMEALGAAPEKRLSIEIYEDINGYGFKITNNGPMIPKNLLERVWWRGFTTKGGGRGMGLHIVKTLIDENGGKISISSTAESTVFTGHFPIQMENESIWNP